jgi:predicted metal-dependent phosphoesterase TrpH
MDPFVMLRKAQEIGLDGVVITEHDYLWPEGELEELREEAPGLTILAGIEVSTREGHFLAYGVQDPGEISPWLRLTDLCNEMHRQGGVVVAAHPFRSQQQFDQILSALRPKLDGLELMSGRMNALCRQRAAQVYRADDWAALASSDAHHEDSLGCCFTEFSGEIHTMRDLIAAIRSRRTIALDGRKHAQLCSIAG